MNAYTICYTKQNVSFLISNEDLYFVSQYTWTIARGYVRRTKDGRYLHNLLVNPKQGMVSDHINRDKLDNRRCNLRECNRHQNLLNTSKRRDNKSGYRGITKTTGRDTYEYNIWLKGKRIRRCGFLTAQEASGAYLVKAKELFGEYAPCS